MSLEDLYQEIILDHYKNPRNKGQCPCCDTVVHQDNPLCGDEINLGLAVQDGRIARIAHDGHGCSISQASASMMTEEVEGLSSGEALELAEQVRQMMHGNPPAADLGDLMALEGVSKFPVRIKCALLPWSALRQALAETAGKEE